MTKQLIEYNAKLISITPRDNPNYDDWSWRLKYVGMIGKVAIMQKRHIPSEIFIDITFDNIGTIRTSCGISELNDNIFIFTTKQSIYEFEIITRD